MKLIYIYRHVKQAKEENDPEFKSNGGDAAYVSLFLEARRIVWNDTKKDLLKFKVLNFEPLFNIIHRLAFQRTCAVMRNEIETEKITWRFFYQQWKFQRVQAITRRLKLTKKSRTFTVDDHYFAATTERVSLGFCKEYFLESFLGQGGEACIYTGKVAVITSRCLNLYFEVKVVSFTGKIVYSVIQIP